MALVFQSNFKSEGSDAIWFLNFLNPQTPEVEMRWTPRKIILDFT